MNHLFTRIHTPQSLCPEIPFEDVLEIERNRELRIEENPALSNLLFLSRTTRRMEFYQWFRHSLQTELHRLERNPDPYRRNLPPLNRFPISHTRGTPVFWYRANEALSIPLGPGGTNQNVLNVGPTGFGKTNINKLLANTYGGSGILVLFSPKGDLEPLSEFDGPGEVVVLDPKRDVNLAFSDCSSFLSREELVSKVLEVLDPHLHLGQSNRLFAGIMKGMDPEQLSLATIISKLEGIEAARTSHLGGSRDQLLTNLKGLRERTGGLFASESSNFLTTLFSRSRTFILKTGGLNKNDASLLACWMYQWIYEKRRVTKERHPPVVFFFDDGMPLVYGTRAKESEGRTVPLATWAFMGRSLGIGMVVSAQNFSLISPSLRNNTSTVICVGSFGEDQSAISRFMGLDPDQSALLPRLRRGEAVAIARNQWPLALRGIVPEVR